MEFEKLKNEKLKIGVIGYSNPALYNEKKAIYFCRKEFHKPIYDDGEKWVVSGYSNVGIPKIAYDEAKKLGWKTVGFSAREVLKYDLYPVDKKIIIGEKFGDESLSFIKYIDLLVKLGGGKQSIREYKLFKKLFPDKYAIEYKL